jgi:hypothetical protein
MKTKCKCCKKQYEHKGKRYKSFNYFYTYCDYCGTKNEQRFKKEEEER